MVFIKDIFFSCNLDEVTGDWVYENSGLSNEEEDDISSNIDNALKLYLDEVEYEDGSQDGNGQKRSDRSKRFTVEFNGMQGNNNNFIFRNSFLQMIKKTAVE